MKADFTNTYTGLCREIDNENQWAPVLLMEVKVLTNFTSSPNIQAVLMRNCDLCVHIHYFI